MCRTQEHDPSTQVKTVTTIGLKSSINQNLTHGSNSGRQTEELHNLPQKQGSP